MQPNLQILNEIIAYASDDRIEEDDILNHICRLSLRFIPVKEIPPIDKIMIKVAVHPFRKMLHSNRIHQETVLNMMSLQRATKKSLNRRTASTSFPRVVSSSMSA